MRPPTQQVPTARWRRRPACEEGRASNPLAPTTRSDGATHLVTLDEDLQRSVGTRGPGRK